jgi:hypothetical protein
MVVILFLTQLLLLEAVRAALMRVFYQVLAVVAAAVAVLQMVLEAQELRVKAMLEVMAIQSMVVAAAALLKQVIQAVKVMAAMERHLLFRVHLLPMLAVAAVLHFQTPMAIPAALVVVAMVAAQVLPQRKELPIPEAVVVELDRALECPAVQAS